MRSLWPALLCAAGTFVVSTAKSAEPATVGTLSVSDERGSCPPAAALEARVDRLLGAAGQTRARMQAAGIGASVHFAVEGGAQRADIELHGARSGKRTLSDDGADCRELAEATALTLAILIDPSFVPPHAASATSGVSASGASANLSPNPGTPEAAPQPIATPVQTRAVPAVRPPLATVERPAASTSASVVAGAGIASRLTRPLVPALSGGIAFDFSRRFGVRALGLWVLPSDVDIPPGKVALELVIGSLEACAHFPQPTPSFRASICAGFSAGAIAAAGRDYRESLSTRQPFYAVEAGIAGDLPLGEPIGLWIDGKAYVPLTTYPFEVTGAGTVEATKIPAFSAVLGLRLRLF